MPPLLPHFEKTVPTIRAGLHSVTTRPHVRTTASRRSNGNLLENTLWPLHFRRFHVLCTANYAPIPARGRFDAGTSGRVAARRAGVRCSTSFSMDPSLKGRARPYVGALALLVTGTALALAGIGGFYYGMHWYIENHVQPTPPIVDEETRKLLRAAAYRETMSISHTSTLIFLQKALDQIASKRQLEPQSPIVQDIVYRMGRAAWKMGDVELARELSANCWDAIKAFTAQAGSRIEAWEQQQTAQVGQLVAAIQMQDERWAESKDTLAVTLQAINRLETICARENSSAPDAVTCSSDDMPYLPAWDKQRLAAERAKMSLALGRVLRHEGMSSDAELLYKGTLNGFQNLRGGAVDSSPGVVSTKKQSPSGSSPQQGWSVGQSLSRWASLVAQSVFGRSSGSGGRQLANELQCMDAAVLLELALNSQDCDPTAAMTYAQKGYQIATRDDIANPGSTFNGAVCVQCAPHFLYVMGQIEEESGTTSNSDAERERRQAAANYYRQALAWIGQPNYRTGVPKIHQTVTAQEISDRLALLEKGTGKGKGS
ncbi:hypothetical protein EV182_001744 [Spiromyces aspiralis]|uniref:Uncharacterized protein n=1 Tax=Spiromyces aspiralis TaxID=68401 RepID=A0ACC1HHT1_9FUNG|nr:hypothetical protein EV182_001744 [Spiromyces aspiralis]